MRVPYFTSCQKLPIPHPPEDNLVTLEVNTGLPADGYRFRSRSAGAAGRRGRHSRTDTWARSFGREWAVFVSNEIWPADVPRRERLGPPGKRRRIGVSFGDKVRDNIQIAAWRVCSLVCWAALLVCAARAQTDLSSALLSAAARGDAPAVSALLKRGARVNASDSNGITGLMHAARGGHLPALQALLRGGAQVDASDSNGFTALAFAAFFGRAEAARALLDAGAGVNLPTKSGATPLMFAALGGHTETVTVLLSAKAAVNAQTSSGVTALIMAADAGKAATVEQLLRARADPNLRDDAGRTALMLASGKGHLAAVRALIAARADLNLPNRWGDTALTWAANEGHLAIVQALVAAGANAEARNEKGATALLFAARGGFVEIVPVLLRAGARVDAVEENGRSALMFAAWNRHGAMLKALLEAGANPNLRDRKGETALMLAAVQGHADIVDALVAAGADVNAQALTGTTALMSAAHWGRSDSVRALLRGAPDLQLRDSRGKTAAEVARESGHLELARLLAEEEAASPRRATAKAPSADQAPGAPGTTATPEKPAPAAGPATAKPDLAQATAPSGLPQFRDVAAQAGIRFQHTNGATPEKYMPETMGAGGLFLDFDNDGWLDILLVDSGSLHPKVSARARNALFRNNRDGSFTDVTARSGIRPLRYGMGACAADYDNDGWVDLYLTGFEGNALYRNGGDGAFTDVTATSGTGLRSWSASCAWGDFDRDGDLDLYVANYVNFTVDNNQFCGDVVQRVRAYCHPNVYKALPHALFRNGGNGAFVEASKEMGVYRTDGNGLGVVVGDYDNDGWPDLYVANDSVPNFLFHNLGKGKFEETGQWAGVAVNREGRPEAGMGTDMGDLDNDGRMDLFVTNLDWEMSTVYFGQGKGLFTERKLESGLGEPSRLMVGFGTAFFDFDNDGLLDVVVANGNILDNASFFRGAATYAQRRQLFHNSGGGKFQEVGAQAGPGFAGLRVGRGLAVGDVDNDGDLDILVNNNGQAAELLINDGGNRSPALLVRLVGQKGNRDAVGARLTLTAGGAQQMREVKAGSSYLAQNDLRVHFGLGSVARVDRLQVRWPSGAEEAFENVEVNQILTIVEGKGITQRVPFRLP
jgi:ankyrin repeat protein